MLSIYSLRPDGTGLYYYNARYYDAGIGKFISADTMIQNTANPQFFNRYSYVTNNPLKYTDPSGYGRIIHNPLLPPIPPPPEVLKGMGFPPTATL